MYFCGYFALPNGPNWEVICIIPIFVVILTKKWVFNPLGDHILDYMGQITKITQKMIVLPTKYPKMRYYMTHVSAIKHFYIFLNFGKNHIFGLYGETRYFKMVQFT